MTIKHKIKWLIVLSVAATLVAVIAILFSHTTSYLTVKQFQLNNDTYSGRQVSVSGEVAPGSVVWDDKSQMIRFELMEGPSRVAVRYQGLVPQNFRPGASIVVNGYYGSDRVLQAGSFGKIRSLCSICH